MNNCFDCKLFKTKECDCGNSIRNIGEYLPDQLYKQIKDLIILQYNCEYFEKEIKNG